MGSRRCILCREEATWRRSDVHLCEPCKARWASPWPVPAEQHERVPQALVDAWKALWEAGGDILDAALRDALDHSQRPPG